jgi:2-aminoadipate transaminase
MLQEAVKMRVAYVPGKPFFPDPDHGFNTMRLNFSHPSDEKIQVGIERLGGLMTEWVDKAKVPV